MRCIICGRKLGNQRFCKECLFDSHLDLNRKMVSQRLTPEQYQEYQTYIKSYRELYNSKIEHANLKNDLQQLNLQLEELKRNYENTKLDLTGYKIKLADSENDRNKQQVKFQNKIEEIKKQIEKYRKKSDELTRANQIKDMDIQRLKEKINSTILMHKKSQIDQTNLDKMNKDLQREVHQLTNKLRLQSNELARAKEAIHELRRAKQIRVTANEDIFTGNDTYHSKDIHYIDDHIKVGDILTIGEYPQGANGSLQPIEWIVLNIENKIATLISKDIIDAMKFDENGDHTWKNSSIRRYLNEVFFYSAKLNTYPIVSRLLDMYADEYDLVSLLTIDEARTYFSDNSKRQAKGSEYALVRHLKVNTATNQGIWWLKNKGSNKHYTSFITDRGEIVPNGYYVLEGRNGLRPVIQVKIGK